jgi:hypothetical protein
MNKRMTPIEKPLDQTLPFAFAWPASENVTKAIIFQSPDTLLQHIVIVILKIV